MLVASNCLALITIKHEMVEICRKLKLKSLKSPSINKKKLKWSQNYYAYQCSLLIELGFGWNHLVSLQGRVHTVQHCPTTTGFLVMPNNKQKYVHTHEHSLCKIEAGHDC